MAERGHVEQNMIDPETNHTETLIGTGGNGIAVGRASVSEDAW
jgi:hypothetical protein